MSRFSMDWLNLREAADLRARNADLMSQAARWLETGSSSAAGQTVVDLGAGTGSTLRAFSSLASPVRKSLVWRLVDYDVELLAEARRRHGGSYLLETVALDLSDIASLPLQGARLITASALFDLVSGQFIENLAAARCRAGIINSLSASTRH